MRNTVKNSLLSLPSTYSSLSRVSLLPVWALHLLSGNAAYFSMGCGGIPVWYLLLLLPWPSFSQRCSSCFSPYSFPQACLSWASTAAWASCMWYWQPGLVSQIRVALPLPELSTSDPLHYMALLKSPQAFPLAVLKGIICNPSSSTEGC